MTTTTRFKHRILPNLERTISTNKKPKRKPDKKSNGHLSNEEVDELKSVCGFLRHGPDGKRVVIDYELGRATGHCYCRGKGKLARCTSKLRSQNTEICEFYPKSTWTYLPALYKDKARLPVPYEPTQTFKKDFCLK